MSGTLRPVLDLKTRFRLAALPTLVHLCRQPTITNLVKAA